MGEPFQLGRYALHAELAAGGMAAVYLARQSGAVGFGKTVAIKRLHPHLAKDPYFATMFLDEARLVARVQHPNVVPILDVVSTDTELFLVLEYVRGETLAGLLRAVRKKGQKIPVPIAAAIVIGLLAGLQAAHEARDEAGKPLDIVHRDVSPQNVMVGADGVSRVLDFGVAKAAIRLQTTREGQLKGKLPYMSPEQLSGEVTARSDVYATALVLWEALTAQRLFKGETEAQVLHRVMTMAAPAPSSANAEVPAALDAVVLKGLERDAAKRWRSAKEMAAAIEACVPVASTMKVAAWIDGLIGPTLAARDAMRAEIESASTSLPSLPEPITSPSLPGFPQVDSSVSIPNVAASTAGLDGASTASLVVVTPHAPARSRLPLVIVAVAAVSALGVVLAITFARPTVPAAQPSVATTAPPSLPTPSISPTPSVTMAPTPSITPAPTASVVASGHHHTMKPPPPHGSSAASGNGNDLNSLLDTR